MQWELSADCKHCPRIHVSAYTKIQLGQRGDALIEILAIWRRSQCVNLSQHAKLKARTGKRFYLPI
jgi:hypothetical protein